VSLVGHRLRKEEFGKGSVGEPDGHRISFILGESFSRAVRQEAAG
jgi:hypothetical protein